MSKIFMSFMISALGALRLEAGVVIDSTKVLEVTISNKGLTRLSVEGDKISDVFVHPNDLGDHLTLHPSGNVFIAGEGIEAPFYLTVITTKGATQDMKISLGKKTLEPLLLKAPQKIKKPQRREVERWLQDFAKGFIAEGFSPSPLKGKPFLSKEFEAFATATYKNKTHEVIEYSVQSLSDKEISLGMEQFARPGEGALLTETQLKPKQTVKLFIIHSTNTEGEEHS